MLLHGGQWQLGCRVAPRAAGCRSGAAWALADRGVAHHLPVHSLPPLLDNECIISPAAAVPADVRPTIPGSARWGLGASPKNPTRLGARLPAPLRYSTLQEFAIDHFLRSLRA